MVAEALPDYYRCLGLTPVATQEEIQTAYMGLRAHWAELAAQGDEEAPTQVRLVDEAFAILADPNQRAAYERAVAERDIGQALTLAGQARQLVTLEGSAVPVPTRQCPHCGAQNPLQVSICQECGQQVTRPCPQCGQPVTLDQRVCLRCQVPIQEYDQRRFAEAAVVEQRVQDERHERESQVRVLEATNAVLHRQGAIFWMGVLVACAALTVLAVIIANLFGG